MHSVDPFEASVQVDNESVFSASRVNLIVPKYKKD